MEDNTTISNPTEQPVAAVTLRLPQFSTTDPTAWFFRAEIQFRLRRIPTDRRSDLVLESLSEEVFNQVSTWLMSFPAGIPFEDLKKGLTERFSIPAAERAARILASSNIPIGDQRAASSWNEFQALARLPPATDGSAQTLDMLRELWLRKLPTTVRANIANASTRPTADLLKIADSLLEAHNAACPQETAFAAAFQGKSKPYRPPARQKQQQFQYVHRRKGPQLDYVAQAKTKQSRCFTVRDRRSGTIFLIDTGACRSFIPTRTEDRQQPPDKSLKIIAANGEIIPTYGTKPMTVEFNGRSYKWDFTVADVHFALLGADFLGHFHILVDVKRQAMISADSLTRTPLRVSNIAAPITILQTDEPYNHLQKEFPQVFKPELKQDPTKPAKHHIVHHIKTMGPPVHSKFRRMAPEKLKIAKAVFREMEQAGLCQKASSPWSSPLHMVQKEDGSWRPCGDYRRLNMMTEPDHYPLPNIQDITNNIQQSSIFSKLDLLKGYYQVPMNPTDIPKTAIATPFGTYTFNYSCFGLRNSGSTFQRLMDEILGDMPFCACYVDDILIFSKTKEKHLQHLRTVLERLSSHGLIVRFDKCRFGQQKVDFLGHTITKQGMTPLLKKVEAILSFPKPETIKKLQQFTGMVNYYHRFLPGIAQILSPLYNALSGNKRKLHWSSQYQEAFTKAKEALAEASQLSFPVFGADLTLKTDASNTAIGAVLEQTVAGAQQPLAFFSRKLRPAETRYSTFDRELLAMHLAVRHFTHLLEGRHFTILTDHKPLIHAFTKAADAWSARQRRHLSAIAEYSCTVKHLPGNQNTVADTLSRSLTSVQLGIDYKQLAEAQEADREVNALQHNKSLNLQKISFNPTTAILCDVSTGKPRPVVPRKMKKQVFNLIHGLSHPSARSSVSLISQRFVWNGLNKDIKEWCRLCLPCQSSKVTRHTESGIADFKIPTTRLSHIHVDIVGPLPSSSEHKYLFTIIDRTTRWPDAIPLRAATAADCARALLQWISSHGIPNDITSDRGSTFTSRLWKHLAESLGTQLHHTTSYNPEANGMVERLHRTLKAALMSRCNSSQWYHQLPWILLGLRTAPHEGLKASPAEALYGQTLTLPAEFFKNPDAPRDPTDVMNAAKKFLPSCHTHKGARKTFSPKGLEDCTHIFLRRETHRRPLTRPYYGPFRILQRKTKTVQILLEGMPQWVSIDRAKPAFLQPQDTSLPPSANTRASKNPCPF